MSFCFEGLRLAKLEQDELSLLLELKQESWFGTHRISILNQADQERWFRSLDEQNLVIVARENELAIGIFKVFAIDWQNRTADVGWDVFSHCRGRGLANRLVRAGVALCFKVLNLHRLEAQILASNLRSQRCAENAGFVLEGRRRRCVHRGSGYLDSLTYGVLVSDNWSPTNGINFVLDISTQTCVREASTLHARLRAYIGALVGHEHGVEQITLLLPFESRTAIQEELRECLPSHVGNARLELLYVTVSQLGMGRFGWLDQLYGDQFDHYLLMEFPYAVMVNDIGSKLRAVTESVQDDGVVALSPFEARPPIGWFVSRSRLRDLAVAVADERSRGIEAQGLSRLIAHLHSQGLIRDVTEYFKVVYLHEGQSCTAGPAAAPLIIQPLEPVPKNNSGLVVLILLLYYERPQLVRNALKSVLRADAHYPHWRLAVLDDRSTVPVAPIVDEILASRLQNVKNYRIPPDGQAESSVGRYMNQAIQEFDADIAIMLCDDDELHPEYLANLNRFFQQQPSAMSCYSLVHLYNPAWEDAEFVDNLSGPLNAYREPVPPAFHLDASQVAWRTIVNKQLGAWFEHPKTTNLDAGFYQQLTALTGPTPFSGFVAQYKGIHPGQLADTKKTGVQRPVDADAIRRVTPVADVLSAIEYYESIGKPQAAARLRERALHTFEGESDFLTKK